MADLTRYTLPVIDDDVSKTGETRIVAVRDEDTALRVILDADLDDPQNRHYAPDLFIERHEDHWLLVFHPDGEDPVATIQCYADRVDLEYGRGRWDQIHQATVPLHTARRAASVVCRQLVPDAELDPDDLQDHPAGSYTFTSTHGGRAAAYEDILDQFHRTVPISCLEDFEVSVQFTDQDRPYRPTE